MPECVCPSTLSLSSILPYVSALDSTRTDTQAPTEPRAGPATGQPEPSHFLSAPPLWQAGMACQLAGDGELVSDANYRRLQTDTQRPPDHPDVYRVYHYALRTSFRRLF